MCEHPWEKGEDCAWNQRTARVVLVPILLLILGGSGFVFKKLFDRNGSWVSRPVRCMLSVMISQSCDILEHILVLSEMRGPHGHEWYANSMIDAFGDIFLMYGLYLFSEIWCDNVTVLIPGHGDLDDMILYDISRIRGIYKFVAIATVPLALIFSVGSLTHHYDSFMMIYTLWGIMSGVVLLTPAAFMMQKVVHALPKSVRRGGKPVYKQLELMARVNLYEQVIWNFLMMVTVVCIILFLAGGGKSSAMIGTASVAISISWIIMHLQVVLFFVAVTKASGHSPVFDHSMLESLVVADQGDETGSEFIHSQNEVEGDKVELSVQTTDALRNVVP